MNESITLLESAAADLIQRIDDFGPLDSPGAKTHEGSRILHQCATAIDALGVAREEVEAELVRLDKAAETVLIALEPKIEQVYRATRDAANGDGNTIDELHATYISRRERAVRSEATIGSKLRPAYSFRIPSGVSTLAVNALLIGGFLGALVFSRFELVPHLASVFGFLAGAGVVLCVQMLIVFLSTTRSDNGGPRATASD
jgi:hypothetical protein